MRNKVPVVLAPRWTKNDLWKRARAVPSLDLRFAENKSLVDSVSGQNLITFTRASTGTFVDSDGVVRSAGNDVPRFDHNPLTGECLGLLPEEQRQNLLLRSEEFETTWSTSNLLAFGSGSEVNAAVAPNGTLTADKLIENTTASATHNVSQAITFTSGTTYTLSVYAKTAGRNIRLGLPVAAFGSAVSATFDLTTGSLTATANSPTATSISALPDGWFRISITASATSTASATPSFNLISGANSITYTGDGTSGIYLWGAQLEAGSGPPTSYIPTTGTAATRTADVASVTGTNFSSWYRQDEGTMFVQSVPVSTIGNGVFGVDDTTNNERWRIGHSGTSAGGMTVVDGGVVQAALSTLASVAPLGATMRAAGAYRLNDFSCSVNEVQATPDTSGTVPTVTQATIGTAQATTYNNGPIRRLTYWPTRLPNSTLQSITQ
jgi:hypothetical protein